METDLKLAKATGIDNDNVRNAQGQLQILEQQIAILSSWTKGVPVGEVLQAEVLPTSGTNGRDAVPAH